MKLIKLTATFGCLDGATLEFDRGFTLITAPNGAGKSTWCAFLRTMLYGLDTRQRDKKGAPADKNRYRPWNGAPMEGLMVCRHRGRTLEIRRTSAAGAPMGEFSAVDLDTGLPVPGLTADNLGEALTGVSREVFDRSVFLRQTDLAVTRSQELERRMAALVSAGEEDVSWSAVDEQLRVWQRRRRYHKSGLLPQLEEEERELLETQSRTAQLRRDLAQAQARAETLERQKAHWDSRLARETDQLRATGQRRYEEAAAELTAAQQRVEALEAQGTQDQHGDWEHLEEEMEDLREEQRSRSRLMAGFVVLVVLLSLALAAVWAGPRYLAWDIPLLPLFLFGAVGAGLWLLVLVAAIGKAVSDRRGRRARRHIQDLLEESRRTGETRDRAWEEAVARREQARKYLEAVSRQGSEPYLPPEAQACGESLQLARQEIANLRGQLEALGDPLLVDAQLDSVRERMAHLQRDYDALDVALDALREADETLHARFSPQLSQRAGEYFARLTQGRYTQVDLTRSMEITVREGARLADQPLGYLSQGTADQLYLALRLALADLVLPQEVPMVLDDALLTFDDTRHAQALAVLLELAQQRQVILFTCQRREFRALADRPEIRRVDLTSEGCQAAVNRV